MKLKISVLAVAATLGTTALAGPVEMAIEFTNHLAQGMSEQDVFIERPGGAISGEVFRVTAEDRDMEQPLYAASEAVAHNPLDPSTDGPWPMGKSLGMTQGEWLAAEGSGSYTCEDGEGRLQVAFSGLVPDGVYTMWHFFMAMPPTDPFIGTFDLPLGSRDGTQSVFVAADDGTAMFDRSFAPCLQLSGEHLTSGLAIAWHSDGRTYGPLPGEFGKDTHVQLFTGLPAQAGM